MVKAWFWLSLVLAIGNQAAGLAAGASACSKHEQTQRIKPIKILIGNIRYQQNRIQHDILATHAIAKYLLGERFAELAPEQQKQLEQDLGRIIASNLLQRGKQLLQNMDSIAYQLKTCEQEQTWLTTTLLMHGNRKKPMQLHWHLRREQSAWKLFDVQIDQDNLLDSLKQKQIDPSLKQIGIQALIARIHDKAYSP